MKSAVIEIKKPTHEELELLGVKSWGTWTCPVSKFDWEYDDKETCYFLKGEVIIETEIGNFNIEAGDLVVLKKGLKCVWDVKKTVEKVYKFG